MYRKFHKRAKEFAHGVENDARARMYTACLNSNSTERLVLKLVLLTGLLFAILAPLWFGLALYAAVIGLASLLGIAVIALKIAVFIVLLLALGQLQLICLGVGMAIALIIAFA